MKDQLRSHILNRLQQPPPHLERVLSGFEAQRVKRNTVLVEVGEVCRYCYFIVTGCLKISTYNLNGDESTTSLAFEQDWRTVLGSFLHRQPSNERIVAVEPTQLLRISRQQFQTFSTEIPDFQQIYQQVLEESYAKSVQRVQTLMGLDAMDRLRYLLRERPLIFTRLSNRLIASYLGLSESTLSRLKAKL